MMRTLPILAAAIAAAWGGWGQAQVAAPGQDARMARYPASWQRYAELIQYQLVRLIEESTAPEGERLRTIIATPDAIDSKGLIVRVWIDATGQVTRVETPVRPTATVAQDLDHLLVGRILNEAPPPGIPWPAKLVLGSRPAEPPRGAAGPPAK